MPVCITVAQTILAMLPTAAFTLIWTHSVERTEWREEWRIEEGRLRCVEAAVRGSGAGMEPPAASVLINGAWRYIPTAPSIPRLLLATSQSSADYRLCWNGTCRDLASFLPAYASEPVELYACDETTE